MPYRKVAFSNNEIYHTLNRGVAETSIFTSPEEHSRFLHLLDFYRFANPPLSFSRYNRLAQKEKEKFKKDLQKQSSHLVEILAYCLIPNHFHLLLKQKKDKGVPKMLANLQNGYARFFNLKNKRLGPLFQSMFKAVRIKTDEQFLHVSRYIHLNPSSSYLVKIKDLPSYPWSSLPEYLGRHPFVSICPELLLGLAGGREKYKEFIFDQAEYQRELNKIKSFVLENSQIPHSPTINTGC